MLEKCEADELTLISSEILMLEVERNPQPKRKAFVQSLLEQATVIVTVDKNVEQRAKILEERGFKAFDALRIASAEAAGADYFCSCDDRVLKKARKQTDLSVKVVSPLELAEEVSS